MKWKGIVTDTTDVDDTEGVSVYQQNTRMLIEGELQRRHGLIATGLSKASGAILNLAGGSGFIVTGIDGQADGVPDTISAITGPKRKPPVIVQTFPGEAWTILQGLLATNTQTPGVPYEGPLPLSYGICPGHIDVIFDFFGFTDSIVHSLWRGPVGTGTLLDSRTITKFSPGFTVSVPFDAPRYRYFSASLTPSGTFTPQMTYDGFSDMGCG